MEQWPNGPEKTAGLAAARSAIAGLAGSAGSSFVCSICANAKSPLILMPRGQQEQDPIRLAA